jgi:predicted nucleic acid-binding protein
MNGNNLLIDTNIALYLFNGDTTLSYALEGKTVYISFITELELLSYPDLTPDDENIINEFIDDCIVIDVNQEIKRQTIRIKRNYNLKIPDAIIASTAAYLKLPLLSADADFKKLDQMNLIYFEK